MEMGNIKRMDQLRAILKTYHRTQSYKSTSRILGVSRNTVKAHLKRFEATTHDLTALCELSDEALYTLAYPVKKIPPNSRLSTFVSLVPYWLKELKRVGVTRQLLWEEYKAKHPDGFGYTQFCVRLKTTISNKDLSIAMAHKPGEFMQVDFAGKKLSWVDLDTGEVIRCEVLVVVMPHSQMTYVIALASQKVGDFVHGLSQAFYFFGGLPEAILSDNLKSYVTKSNKYEPVFNELCIQLSEYYEVDLAAARVAKPKDKASVENMVSTVYTRVYAVLRNQVFHSLEALNKGIEEALKVHNNKPFQKRVGSRFSIFKTAELPVLRPLPSELFEVKNTTKSKVRKDYHVTLGEDRNYYSVPFQYVAKQATLIYTSKTVEIYIDNQRVATHKRFVFKQSYKYTTIISHMPTSHQEWAKSRGFNTAYFVKQGAKIGIATQWAIEQVLTSKFHEAQAFNSCQGILRLAKTYSKERLENAAAKSKKVGTVSYSMLRRILENKMDLIEEQQDNFKTEDHVNIRGPEAYQ